MYSGWYFSRNVRMPVEMSSDPASTLGHSMMVGMRVPHRRTYTISDAERQTWAKILEHNRAQAAAGVGMKESLEIIRSPNFKVKPGFYHYP